MPKHDVTIYSPSSAGIFRRGQGALQEPSGRWRSSVASSPAEGCECR